MFISRLRKTLDVMSGSDITGQLDTILQEVDGKLLTRDRCCREVVKSIAREILQDFLNNKIQKMFKNVDFKPMSDFFKIIALRLSDWTGTGCVVRERCSKCGAEIILSPEVYILMKMLPQFGIVLNIEYICMSCALSDQELLEKIVDLFTREELENFQRYILRHGVELKRRLCNECMDYVACLEMNDLLEVLHGIQTTLSHLSRLEHELTHVSG